MRKLAKNGVKLISITQDLGDDPMIVMMRQIMTLFDEYQSKENAKHTLRAMNENARQGFWNGALPPIGYRVVEAERRGVRVKKRLEIDPLYADLVRRIFRMALNGVENSGPMGIKRIATWLNEHGFRTRSGGRWGIGSVHEVLTRTTYIGKHHFNTRSNKGELKPETEHIVMDVPALVSEAQFEAVQRLLKAKSPKMMVPRFVSGPTLLTGICSCGCCGGAMTLRSGKNASGTEYRYYTCSTKARQGEKDCPGLTIPMNRLDRAVSDHLEARLLNPERLEEMLEHVLEERGEWVDERRRHVAELRRRSSDAETKLKRVYG